MEQYFYHKCENFFSKPHILGICPVSPCSSVPELVWNWSRCLFVLPSSRNLQLGHCVSFLFQRELTHFPQSVLVTSDSVLEPYLSCSLEDSLDELLRDNLYPKAKTGQECSGPGFLFCSQNLCVTFSKRGQEFSDLTFPVYQYLDNVF